MYELHKSQTSGCQIPFDIDLKMSCSYDVLNSLSHKMVHFIRIYISNKSEVKHPSGFNSVFPEQFFNPY